MTTNCIMETTDRVLNVLGNKIIVRQRTKDSYFAVDDVVLICDRFFAKANRPRFIISNYLKLESTKRFFNALESAKGDSCYYPSRKGKTGWIHPSVMIDMLLYANAEFKVEIYDWLLDSLISNRINSGDSYNKMCGVLYNFAPRKQYFHLSISRLAKIIKERIGVKDWNKATKEQLEQRDYLHNIIADLTLGTNSIKQGIELGFLAWGKRYDKKGEIKIRLAYDKKEN